MLMLNALDGTHFNWLHKNLVMQFSNAKTIPTEKEVTEAINLAGYDNRRVKQANAFQQQEDVSPKKKCTNCGNTRHLIDGCWEKGGGAEGKAQEWWKKSQDKESVKLGKKAKEKANAAKDSNTDDSHIEKVNITVVEDDFTGCFKARYISCPTIKVKSPEVELESKHPQEKCSVLWDNRTTRAPIDPGAVQPMTVSERTVSLETPDIPFYVDSGATSHCSTVCADFFEPFLIELCSVRGMNGSCVSAIGRGTIKMKCTKGKNLILRNILYIPRAALQLISVGCLADNNIKTTFNKTKCTI
jgi:hypothetical protein